jgi:hypothetical protein
VPSYGLGAPPSETIVTSAETGASLDGLASLDVLASLPPSRLSVVVPPQAVSAMRKMKARMVVSKARAAPREIAEKLRRACVL